MTTPSPALIAELDNPFWRFSLSVYQNKAVKEACLSFQDKHKANVNLLLLCCWLAYAVDDISQTELLKACHSIDSWDENVTQCLRNTRRWVTTLKHKEPWILEFSQQLTIDEIVSETYQQHKLFCCFEKKQKKLASKNEELAIRNLCWLFSDMKSVIQQQLIEEINNFVTMIFSMVTNDEENKNHNRD